ncbi:MAG: murein biosynthesis integral membrane protein MurJ [Elusimicrobiota bacterium]|jgi:putative peptidoglycan lipid II flippase
MSTQPHHRLARSAGIFTGATLLSRILGYLRDTMVAAFFGASAAADAFYTAFRISNLLRRLLGEGALSASFVPVFSEYTQTRSKEETQRFLNTIFTTLLVLLSILTLLGMVFAPQLTRLIARGFEPGSERFALTVILTRYMFPFILFISLAALITGVLNAFHSFFLPALAPACLSVAEMLYLGFLWVAHINGQNAIVGLAVSVTVGGLSQFFILIPALMQRGYSLSLRWEPKHEAVRRVERLMLPATLGVSADQLNAFVDTMMASFLSIGSVTALYYSNRVMQLPLALFGIALSQVALPTMSASVARGATHEVKETLNFALRLTLFMILPATTGLILLGYPIVQTLFQYGRFSANASAVTTWALTAFSIGLLAYAAVKILASAFYAHQTTRVPVIVASGCVALNIALNLTALWARTVLSSQHPEWAEALNGRIGVASLALSTSIASWVNASVLFILLRRKIGLLGGRRILRTILKSGIGCLAMTLFCWGVLHLRLTELPLAASHLRIARAFELLVAIAGGAGVYLAVARLLRMEEWEPFWSQLSHKPVASDIND